VLWTAAPVFFRRVEREPDPFERMLRGRAGLTIATALAHGCRCSSGGSRARANRGAWRRA
jgi:hypothetical protein